MHAIGSDQSQFAIVALAFSMMVSVALVLAPRQQDDRFGKTRTVLAKMGILASTLSALGLVSFSLTRLFFPPHDGRHYPYFAAIAMYFGLPLSIAGILGTFATGGKRVVVVLSSMTMPVVWFITFLDNVNW